MINPNVLCLSNELVRARNLKRTPDLQPFHRSPAISFIPKILYVGWSVGLKGHGMRNMILSILKGVGMALGVILLALGGFMGIENMQAPGTINFTIFIFSVAAILVGSFMLWLVFKKKENM